MDDKDKIEAEEYKKRIKEFIDRVEKDKDKTKDSPISEQQVIEAKETLKQTAISKIHPDYRSERIVLVFAYMIRDYYRRKADPNIPTEKEQFQEEIDALYNLIYEELKKPSLNFLNLSPYRRKTTDLMEKRSTLEKMTKILGVEHITLFYNEYDIYSLVDEPSHGIKNEYIFKSKVLSSIMLIIVLIIGIIIFLS